MSPRVVPPRPARMHAVARPQKRQCRRRRRRESVRQQVEEFDQSIATRRAKTRREIRDRCGPQGSSPPGSTRGCRRAAASRPATPTSARPPRGRTREAAATRRSASDGRCCPSPSMISTKLAVGGANPGFHRGAIALVVRVPDHACALFERPAAGIVRRSVVDDQDLLPDRDARRSRHQLADRRRLVHGGNHHRGERTQRGSVGHVAKRKLMMSPSCTMYSLPSSRTSP